MKKIISADEAVNYVPEGATVAVGGFLGVGTPETIISALVDASVKDLTIIGNDTSFIDKGIGRLIASRQAKKVIVSHIGTNPETGRLMNTGELTVDLVPQGTLAERLRCGGAGLGGVLTPTGLGTVVAENKRVLTVDGKEYLLETALRADVALIKAAKADTSGNLICNMSARNFNPIMAMAADIVIAEVEEIVEAGAIDPDQVIIPGIFIDYLCLAERGK